MIESPPNELFLLLLSIKTETRAAIKSDLNQRAALVALSSFFFTKSCRLLPSPPASPQSAPSDCSRSTSLRKTLLSPQRFLRLSRACIGKMIIFSTKMAQKDRSRTVDEPATQMCVSCRRFVSILSRSLAVLSLSWQIRHWFHLISTKSIQIDG